VIQRQTSIILDHYLRTATIGTAYFPHLVRIVKVRQLGNPAAELLVFWTIACIMPQYEAAHFPHLVRIIKVRQLGDPAAVSRHPLFVQQEAPKQQQQHRDQAGHLRGLGGKPCMS